MYVYGYSGSEKCPEYILEVVGSSRRSLNVVKGIKSTLESDLGPSQHIHGLVIRDNNGPMSMPLVLTGIHTCKHTYIHAYICTHIYTYTFTYIRMFLYI